MSGIVRQSDQYAAFDNTPRPERVAYEAPAEIIAEYTRGRRVGDGQNNPRGIKRRHFADMSDVGDWMGDVANNTLNAVSAVPQVALDLATGNGNLDNSFDQMMHPSTGPVNSDINGIGSPVTPP